MPCYAPIRGWRWSDGRLRDRRPPTALGLPHQVLNVPCGRCMECKLESSRQWAVRMMHEAQLFETLRGNAFVTLTFDNDHLPENNSLDVKCWQLFAKRFRNQIGPFRFFHCGEYGEEKGRAHLHACLFGQSFLHDRIQIKNSKSGFPQWESQTLTDTWENGKATISDLTFESAAYVSRYCTVKKYGDEAEEHLQGRNPEYATMSRNPGLGQKWIEKYLNEVYPRDSVFIRGKYCKPPLYYDRFCQTAAPDLWEQVRQKRVEEIDPLEHTQERLDVKKTVSRAQWRTYKRETK